ncbi:MAG: DNA internalization-related competence protein ComEC/Rec2 [Deltaproteobacteria bacterium]|nr:DNA internalization-related competence protein ComEC/Rec2 [Deltaproteobacteria bacterium]
MLFSATNTALFGAFVAGLICGQKVPWPLSLTLVGLAAGAGVLIIIAAIGWTGPAASSGGVVLFFILGLWLVQSALEPYHPPNDIWYRQDAGPIILTGVVIDQPAFYPDHVVYVMDAQWEHQPDRDLPRTGVFQLSIDKSGPVFRYGDRVRMRVDLRPVRNYNNPGLFDYRLHMLSKGVSLLGHIPGNRLAVVVGREPPSSIMVWVEDFRQRVREFIDTHMPVRTRPVLRGLWLGEQSILPQDVQLLFIRTGCGHVMAVSGFNLVVVAGAFYVIFYFLLSRSERLFFLLSPHKTAVFMAFVPATAYALVTGMAVATLRSLVMMAVFLVVLGLSRVKDVINALILGAFLMLSASPLTLFNVSFQLSSVAVLGLVIMMDRWPSALFNEENRYLNRLNGVWLFFAVSLASWLVTLPISAHHFAGFSIMAVVANIVAVPLLGYLAIPLGLMVMALLPISSWMAEFIGLLGAVAASWTLDFLGWLSSSPLAMVDVALSWAEAGIFYVVLFSACFIRKRTAQVILVAGLCLTLVDVSYWYWYRHWRSSLVVTFLDVGQGTSTVVEFPRGPTMVVDGGGNQTMRFDPGERVLIPFLLSKKIYTIDYAVLSHPHIDHLGGLVSIVKRFKVGQFWSTGVTDEIEYFRELRKSLAARGVPDVYIQDLAQPRRLGTVETGVIYPPAELIMEQVRPKWLHLNNTSLVLRLVFNQVSFLIPGDIEKEAETILIASGQDISATVLLVPHHGSKTSSTPEFISRVGPRYVVIPVGYRNQFHLPHPTVVARYQAAGARVYRTDRDGAVIVETDGRRLNLTAYAE